MENKNIKTLKGIKKYVKDYIIENFESLENVKENSVLELIHEDSMLNNIKKFACENVSITYKQGQILFKNISYAKNYEELQFYILCDVLDYMIVGKDITIAQAKKHYLEN